MCERIKKKNNFEIYVIAYILVVSSVVFLQSIGNMDELWKYNICQAIANGKRLYKDISLVNTPLIYLIGALFVKIHYSLISFKILTVIMWTTMLSVFHLIALKFNQSNLKILAINLFFILFCNIQNALCLCYNQAVLLASLVIIYILLRDKISTANMFEIGLLNSLAILCKYSTGIVVCLCTIIVLFYKVKNKKENNAKQSIVVKTIVYFTGLIVPMIVFVLYLAANNSLLDFYNMTIVGAGKFKNNALSIQELIDNVYILVFFAILLIIPILIVVDIVKHKNFNKEKVLVVLFAVANFAAAYPMFDTAHFYQGFYVLALLIPVVKDEKRIKWEIVSATTCFILLIYLIGSGMAGAQLRKINGYGYVFTTDYTYNKFNKIEKFVYDNNGHVKIMDPYAAFYDISLDRYIKYEGCFLNGNLGEKTPIEAFESIVGEEDVVLMYDKKDITNRQFPIEICDYIESHYKRDGKIEGFNVYKKR